jgi:PAS domain S-box-containing protein
MNWLQIVFPLTLLTAAIASIFAAVTSWRQRPAQGALPLALLLITVSAWSVISGLTGLISSTAQFNLLTTLTVICQVSTATLLLIFVLEYTRQDYFLARNRILLLWLIPLLIAILALSNGAHQAFWLSPEREFDPGRYIFLPGGIYGPYLAYIYLIRLIATLLLVRAVLRIPANYRAHATYLLVASIVTWLAVVVKLPNLDNLFPVWAESLQPVTYALSGIIIAWGIFRHQLINLVPIARDTLLDNLLDGIIVLDNQCRVVDINRAARYLLQLNDQKHIIGMHFEQSLTHLPEIEQALTISDMPYQDIYLPPPADLSLEVMNTPIYDSQGQMRGNMLVLHDISIRVRSEAALRQSEQNLRNVFEHADAGIYLLDPNGSITFSNERWTEMLGVPANNLMGKSVSEYIFKSDIPYSRYLFESLIAGDVKNFSLEIRYCCTDGQIFWGAVSAIPIYDSNNQVLSVVNFVSDITAILNMELGCSDDLAFG